jgi:leucyl-tRNA synthetase
LALAKVGSQELLAQQAWPEAEPALLEADSVVIAVQVNGKLRGTIEMPPGADEKEVLAAAEEDPNVARQLAGKTIAKRVYVPGKIVNFVVRK